MLHSILYEIIAVRMNSLVMKLSWPLDWVDKFVCGFELIRWSRMSNWGTKVVVTILAKAVLSPTMQILRHDTSAQT